MEETNDTWNGLAVSVIGNDHVRREQPLQDASAAILSPRPAAVVCDGAGSAPFSHDGANAAVRAFRIVVAALEPMIANCLDNERTPWGFAKDLWHYVAGWICRALAAARDEVARTGSGNPGDYAFTFAAAIVGKLRVGFIQVGDGAIAVRTRTGTCDLVFKPEKGSYANETTFLASQTVEEDTFLTRVLPASEILGVMVMSDGPEVRMLDLANNKPAPIIGQMLEDFGNGEADRATLLLYLTDSRWTNNPRGGDDKSVALLVPNVLHQT